MKKLITCLLAVAMILGLCACGSSEAVETQQAEPQGLQVGFAREKVMPEGTPELEGTSGGRIMKTVMGILTVTCVAVKGENGETVLLYTMDRLNSGETWTAPVRKAISMATGIAEDHIMIAATHTHSAPRFSNWDGADKYKSDFQAAMVKVGEDALADLSPAQMYIGSTSALIALVICMAVSPYV